jgi:cobyrinic acid a,c-diamide synthase
MNAFLIAGTASGVGKTTTALALMAAFRQRGFAVQPFKCGPDFLDTGHHTVVSGRVSRNLDTWMLDGETNQTIFENACMGADVAIVEGMMGLFDGVAGGTEEGSSAEIAKLLHLPVILVLDASKSSRSIAAVVKGFETFDPGVRMAAIVLNGVAGESHFRMLERSICSTSDVPILGWLPRNPAVMIPERHLGLHTAAEQTNVQVRFDALAAFAETNLKIDLLLLRDHPWNPDRTTRSKTSIMRSGQTRIGVARDRGFSFYYEDNFDLLRECGAEIIEFSPLSDEHLPAELDGLYLGGGYPELYAEQLSENRTMLAEVRAFADAGKPIYAECGGMMYLAQSLTNLEGNAFAMTGVLPITVEMTKRLVHFGYAGVEFMEDCLLGKKGTMVRGHSFHCSQATITGDLQTLYRVRYSLSGREEIEGYSRGNLLASYIHLHFRGNPSLAAAFVTEANRSRQQAEVTS